MDEGVFHYKSKGTPETCGLYFLADPDKAIVITIDYLNAECHQQGLISVSPVQSICALLVSFIHSSSKLIIGMKYALSIQFSPNECEW